MASSCSQKGLLKFVATILLAIICCKQLVSGAVTVNDRPIIGVLSQGIPSSLEKYGTSYIAASYVKYLESSGSRVVPIFVNQTDEYYTSLFNSINGVLFPGGGIYLNQTTGYPAAAYKLYNLAIEANKNGDYFPLWGTCLGVEELLILTAGEDILRHGINADDISIPVDLSPGYEKSRLLNRRTTPQEILKVLTTENSTYNHHNLGVTPTNFSKSDILKSFYQILSTNHDMSGVEFLSMIEAYHYPIYGTQWHPEKNPFEWEVNACHTMSCVQLAQFMGNFFVQEARKSNHHFRSKEEEAKHLIYNYQPTPIMDETHFEQAYFFP